MMMAAFYSLNLLSYVRDRINSGHSHRAIVEQVKAAYPDVRGISIRSLKRFCAAHNLHSTSRCSDHALDLLVEYGVGLVRS